MPETELLKRAVAVREFSRPRTPEEIERCQRKLAQLAAIYHDTQKMMAAYNRWCEEQGL